jgi:hypothetical protein
MRLYEAEPSEQSHAMQNGVTGRTPVLLDYMNRAQMGRQTCKDPRYPGASRRH